MKKNSSGSGRPNQNTSGHIPQKVTLNSKRGHQRTNTNRSPGYAQAVRSRPQNSSGDPNTTMRPNFSAKKGRRRKKTSGLQIFLRVIMIVLIIIVIAFAGAFVYKEYLTNQITYIPIEKNPSMKNEEGSIVSLSDVVFETTSVAMPALHGIHNILLIGIDSRSSSYSEDGSGNLADIIMILTVNENENSIKLSSIQRDSYVYIPGYSDPQKINAAMTFGGPQLLILAIENHLRINLEQYAYVDMKHMEKVVNAVGGVTVNVSEAERTNPLGGLNELVAEQNKVFGSPDGSHMLTQTGRVTLDGRQAVAYARIRYVGNGDYERSQRQIEVLESLMHRYMDLGIVSKAAVLTEVLSLISTNMTENEIEGYALTFLPKLSSAEFQYFQIPVKGYSNEGTYSDFRQGEWSIRTNWNGMIPLVQEFIFGETFPFDPVPVIPKAPASTPTPSP